MAYSYSLENCRVERLREFKSHTRLQFVSATAKDLGLIDQKVPVGLKQLNVIRLPVYGLVIVLCRLPATECL